VSTSAAGKTSRPQRRAPIADWRESYQAHLESPEWASIRDAVRQRSGGLCEQCKEKPARHVHHLTYKRLGAEPLDDLLHLCLDCHQVRHPHRKIEGANPLPPPPEKKVKCYLCGQLRNRGALVVRGKWLFCKNTKRCKAARQRKPKPKSKRFNNIGPGPVARDREARQRSPRLDGLPVDGWHLPHTALPARPISEHVCELCRDPAQEATHHSVGMPKSGWYCRGCCPPRSGNVERAACSDCGYTDNTKRLFLENNIWRHRNPARCFKFSSRETH
jgi:hypothetical protein